jgi:hypothetical protein
MKKILIALAILTFCSSSAQFSVVKLDGTPILDGDIITFTEATVSQASLDFHVVNNTSAPLLTKILFVSATNYDGTEFQLCYLVDCYYNIVVGQSYPTTDFPIPANGQNGNFDHFLNTNSGDGTNYPMDFVFKFYAYDSAGTEIGTPINFTYRFDPTLSSANFTSELKNIGVSIKNTLVENDLEFNTENHISMNLYDITGKIVHDNSFESGNNKIDLSHLNSGVYFLNVTNEENKKVNVKIIKK